MNDADVLEELFCLKFELDSLSEVLIKRSSERWMPGFALDFVENDHVKRYEWARQFVVGRSVLDIACGAGWGSRKLAEDGGAVSVVGCDLDAKAIRYARHRNKTQKVDFREANALTLDYVEAFDAVVSFETIEHVPEVDVFLRRISTAVKPGGLFLVSTPISHVEYDSSPANSYHTQEWGFRAFQRLVSKHFAVQKIFLQLYPPVPQVRMLRVGRKFLASAWPSKFGTRFESSISEFNGQYPEKEMGKKRVGFQILVCERK